MSNHDDLLEAALKAVEEAALQGDGRNTASDGSEKKSGTGNATLDKFASELDDILSGNAPEDEFDIDLNLSISQFSGLEIDSDKKNNSDGKDGNTEKHSECTPKKDSSGAPGNTSDPKMLALQNLTQAQNVRLSSLEKETAELHEKCNAAETENGQLRAEIEQLRAQNKSVSDHLIRVSADFDNYRKRVARDQEQMKYQAEERIVTGFLTVIDNLERALSHAQQSKDFDQFLQGIEMTHKLYIQALSKLGCKPFESLGAECDPVYHDVLQCVIDNTKPHNAVIQEHLKGYMMHDRVLRPALVVVSQHDDNQEEAQGENA